jgi:hypothetical protein
MELVLIFISSRNEGNGQSHVLQVPYPDCSVFAGGDQPSALHVKT